MRQVDGGELGGSVGLVMGGKRCLVKGLWGHIIIIQIIHEATKNKEIQSGAYIQSL